MKYRNQISSVPKYLLVDTFYIQNDKGKCANSAKPYHEDPCKRYHVHCICKNMSVWGVVLWYDYMLICLFDLILYVPSTIVQLNRDGSSWVEPVLS